MKISSEHINNLLAYARERHGAPCRVELEWWDDEIEEHADCKIWFRDALAWEQPWPVERILI